MAYIPDDVRQRSIAAHNRCSYCLTTQLVSGAQMHIDHIIPRAWRTIRRSEFVLGLRVVQRLQR